MVWLAGIKGIGRCIRPMSGVIMHGRFLDPTSCRLVFFELLRITSCILIFELGEEDEAQAIDNLRNSAMQAVPEERRCRTAPMT